MPSLDSGRALEAIVIEALGCLVVVVLALLVAGGLVQMLRAAANHCGARGWFAMGPYVLLFGVLALVALNEWFGWF